jgi:hypothetical protein
MGGRVVVPVRCRSGGIVMIVLVVVVAVPVFVAVCDAIGMRMGVLVIGHEPRFAGPTGSPS